MPGASESSWTWPRPRARVEGRETTTWVIFGEEGTAALLGAYTLEGVFLGVDPYGQKLIPVQGLLK